MAKTIAEKLQTKPGNAVFVGPEEGQRALVGPLPDGARFVDGPEGADVVVLFARDRAHLDALLDQHLDDLSGVRAPWVAYLKGKKGGHQPGQHLPAAAGEGLVGDHQRGRRRRVVCAADEGARLTAGEPPVNVGEGPAEQGTQG